MTILGLFLIIVLIAVGVYLVRRFVPMDPPFQSLILWVAIILCVLIVLYAVGVLPGGISSQRVPQIR